jgi:hypothetical protein
MDVQGLAAGIYLVQVTDRAGRVVVQRMAVQ